VSLQKAPHLQDLKQNHFENAKSENSKMGNLFLIGKIEKQRKED
jgi:hypothetical protein